MNDEREQPADQESLHVLVADDDPIFTALASARLSKAGFAVHVVRDGVDAIEALEQRDFDMALVDLSMPRVDGFRLIALIRSTPHLRTLPIIVLSSLTDAGAVDEAYALGADAYLSKPVSWSLLPTHMLHVHKRSRRMADLQNLVASLHRAAAHATSDYPFAAEDAGEGEPQVQEAAGRAGDGQRDAESDARKKLLTPTASSRRRASSARNAAVKWAIE